MEEEKGCCGCWLSSLLAIVVGLFVIVAALYQTRFKYYVKCVLYSFCIMFGGAVGGIISIPYGKSTANHFRMFRVLQILCSFLGLKFHFRHREHIKSDDPFVIIANHQSAIDVLTMTYCWPENCVVMLKSSLKYLPGFNLCAYLCDSIYINRFSKEKAHQTVDNTLVDIVSKKRKVWIYPEGTRHEGEKMLPFKKGAFIIAKQANIPVVCCVFSSYKNFYSYEERRFDEDGDILVEFLPPVDSTQFESVDALSAHCYKLMQETRERLDAEIVSDYQKKTQ